MAIALFAVAAFFAWGVLLNISLIGKPRQPITPGVAAGATVINAAIITIVILAALQLL